jgi:hypothetical protein
MKNGLIDLNNMLFERMEVLSDENLKGKKLKEEIEKAKAMSDLAKDVISTGALILAAQKLNATKELYNQVPENLLGERKVSKIDKIINGDDEDE